MSILLLLPKDILVLLYHFLDLRERAIFSRLSKFHYSNFNPSKLPIDANVLLVDRIEKIKKILSMIMYQDFDYTKIIDYYGYISDTSNFEIYHIAMDEYLKVNKSIKIEIKYHTPLFIQFYVGIDLFEKPHSKTFCIFKIYKKSDLRNKIISSEMEMTNILQKSGIQNVSLPITIFETDIKTSSYFTVTVDYYGFNGYNDNVIVSVCDPYDELYYYLEVFNEKLTLSDWIIIIIQIFYTLAIIQEKHPTFRHNRLHPKNIRVHKIIKNNKINDDLKIFHKINNLKFIIPYAEYNYQIFLSNFDYASIDNVLDEQKQIELEKYTYDFCSKGQKYTDIYYFLSTLKCKGHYVNDIKIPQEIEEFIDRVVPKEYDITTTSKIKNFYEYTTPLKVLMTDPLFAKYIIK